MKIRQDPPCGIKGHYAWTMTSRRFLIFWKRWYSVCLRCDMARRGISTDLDGNNAVDE